MLLVQAPLLTVYVHVTTDFAPAELSKQDDVGIEGIYEIGVNADMPADGLANAALDGFHSGVCVGMLDDFHFVVRESLLPDSAVLQTSEAYDDYSMEKHVGWVDKVWSPFKIHAHYQPQTWIDDEAVAVDGAGYVDVTRQVIDMAKNDLAKLHQLQDGRDSSDDLVLTCVRESGHTGPFTVKVTQAILAAFEVEKLSDITEKMIELASVRVPEAIESTPALN